MCITFSDLLCLLQNTFGASVVTNFHKYSKFNVRSILDPPVKGGKAADAKKVEEKKTTEDEATKDAEATTKDDE